MRDLEDVIPINKTININNRIRKIERRRKMKNLLFFGLGVVTTTLVFRYYPSIENKINEKA